MHDRPRGTAPTLGLIIACVMAVPGGGPAAEAGGKHGVERWEPRIRAFEQKDKKSPPPKNAILFAGSSSIRGWNLAKYFPDLKGINRGFGGSQIADSIHYADRIILPHKPRIVLLYAGDNDIAAGKPPETVCADFARFVQTMHAKLPKTRIVFIAIKPSLARWKLVGKMRDANRRIAKLTKTNDLLDYADIDTPMIGDDGKPRAELFVKDGLHLSHKGYVLWTSVVRPFLE